MYVIKHYRYHAAWVQKEFLCISSVYLRPLHEMLSAMTGMTPDNHEVFEVQAQGMKLYIGFSDGNCKIGTEIHLDPVHSKNVVEVNQFLMTASSYGDFNAVIEDVRQFARKQPGFVGSF